jgi:hypothetical protein
VKDQDLKKKERDIVIEIAIPEIVRESNKGQKIQSD